MQYIEVALFDKEARVFTVAFEAPVLQDILDMVDISPNHTVGVNGELQSKDYRLTSGDRVEIYPPLQIDPKEKRRRLVERKRNRASMGGVKTWRKKS